MKVIRRMTQAENDAALREIRRQCVGVTRKYEVYLDACWLYTLNKCKLKIGKKRAKEIYKLLYEIRKEMQEWYVDENDMMAEWAMLCELKQVGIDVQALYDSEEDAKRFQIEIR